MNAPGQPFGPWLPRLRQGPVRLTNRAEIERWLIHEDERLLVLNKPGDFVCHPSKDGPWSSLVGAVREYLGSEAVHLIFRLDRETSGLVVFAKDPITARRLQMAAQERRYHKSYLAVLTGHLAVETRVDQPLGPDADCVVAAKVRVVEPGAGQCAVTQFVPLKTAGGYTFARVLTETGRKHQIRAHAEWLGLRLVGDKIYGPDPQLFLEFIESGWTPHLQETLLLPRQALHCAEIDLRAAGEDRIFTAPIPGDMAGFCRDRMGFDPLAIERPGS
jgi:23S rRNA pseudouridine1911/1915/1917 synthase